MMPGEQPVEKRSARTTDMQKSGWRRRESSDDARICRICAHPVELRLCNHNERP